MGLLLDWLDPDPILSRLGLTATNWVSNSAFVTLTSAGVEENCTTVSITAGTWRVWAGVYVSIAPNVFVPDLAARVRILSNTQFACDKTATAARGDGERFEVTLSGPVTVALTRNLILSITGSGSPYESKIVFGRLIAGKVA